MIAGGRGVEQRGADPQGETVMPRAMWSGTISFGLVSIPVKLYPAVRRKTVSFNQLDRRTGSRIKQKRVSATDGNEVPYEDIVKGYEVSRDQYVVLSDDELAALSPEATHTIDITDFTDLADIDPVFYDAGYHVAPDTAGRKPYALLARAMQDSGRVAIATFVLRTKQYLCAVRPVDGRLMLSTMVYADELVDPAEISGLDDLGELSVSERELVMATQLIESLYTEFQPERYEDGHRRAVLELIEAKAAGEEITVEPETPREERVVDLMAALEASVAAAKEARSRHPSARPVEAAAAEAEADADADVARHEAQMCPSSTAGAGSAASTGGAGAHAGEARTPARGHSRRAFVRTDAAWALASRLTPRSTPGDHAEAHC